MSRIATVVASAPVPAVVVDDDAQVRSGGEQVADRAAPQPRRLRVAVRQHDHRPRVGLGAVLLDDIGETAEDRPGDPADGRRDTDVEPAVLLRVHADVVAGLGRDGRGVAVHEGPVEVLLLEDLAELLDAPVLDQELQPRPRAQPARRSCRRPIGHSQARSRR